MLMAKERATAQGCGNVAGSGVRERQATVPMKTRKRGEEPMLVTAANNSDPGTARAEAHFGLQDLLRCFEMTMLDATRVRAWIFGRLHSGVCPECPFCGVQITHQKPVQSWAAGRRLRCPDCGRYFTALTGTFLADSKLSLEQFYIMALLLALRVPDAGIARVISRTEETVRAWRRRFASIEERGCKVPRRIDGRT
jgi:transposase-like protein